MEGKDIYNGFLKNRDFTGSTEDSYAQELMTIFFQIGVEIFDLLEKAKKQNKTLKIKELPEYQEEITIEDLEIV